MIRLPFPVAKEAVGIRHEIVKHQVLHAANWLGFGWWTLFEERILH
jgi:hypothetical protein